MFVNKLNGCSKVATILGLNLGYQLKFTRNLFAMLSAIANKPDKDRIKELGPDRSCAEWLLRNGATVKWKGSTKWQTDYNTLPSSDNKNVYFIEEIDVDEAGIMDIGFDHFDGCQHIKRIRFHHLPYMTDSALKTAVKKLKLSLENIELTSCGDISDEGLMALTNLRLLKTMLLRDLPEIRNPRHCFEQLGLSLPNCKITYEDLNKK